MDLASIDYAFGGRTFTGYLADGSRGGRAPGVLVAHEGGGLTQHAKDRALMLAELGYVAFAMDIFGAPVADLAVARTWLGELRANLFELRGRARAALDVLRGHANVDNTRLAAIGFCFGGATVLELARAGADLACVVGFHAGLDTTGPAPPGAIRGKILVCQGADDPLIGADQRASFMAEMTAAKADWQMLVLGGVGHSFTNPEIDAWNFEGFAYDAVADRRAWAAMRRLFDEALGSAPGRDDSAASVSRA